MAFSMFVIVIALIIVSVAFFHYTQGFFSAAISAILCIFAAVLAISYHEILVEKFLAGTMGDVAHGITVIVMFAVIYLVCRVIFDKVVPGNVSLPAGIDKAGAGLMGLVAGVFAAGVCAFAAQTMPFKPALLGYARYQVEGERDVAVPTDGGRPLERFVYDSLNGDQPLHDRAGEQASLMIPADDILMDVLYRVSEEGALSARPVSEVHPDWLTELFGQRLGVQAAAKRTMINKADGSQVDVVATPSDSHKDAGLYLLDRPVKQVSHEFTVVSQSAPRDPVFPKAIPPSQVLVIARVYFGDKAKESKDSLIRLSTGSVRLVTRTKVPGTDGYQWTNYFPLGTMDDGKEFWFNKPDDFLFVDDSASGGGTGDKGIDLVFQVEKDGFLKDPSATPPTGSPVSDGTFIEVKRMGRVALGGQEIRPLSQYRPNPSVQVLRKVLVKKPPPKPAETPSEGSESEYPSEEGSSEEGMREKLEQKLDRPEPEEPLPPGEENPAAMAPKPAPAAAMRQDDSLVVVDLQENPKFYAPIRIAEGSSGDVTVPGGSVTLEEGRLQAIKLDGATPDQLNAGTGEPINRLAVGTGAMIVQVEATPGPPGGGWAWKDRLEQIAVVDTAGNRHAPVGAWAVVNGTIVARYNADGVPSLADYTPAGAPTRIWLAFKLPEEQQVKQVIIADGLLKEFPNPVP